MTATKVIMSFPWDKKSKIESDTSELKESVAKIARTELREDKHTREQALEQFREWIAKTPDIYNCRTDSNFLLRFLRVKKFSVPMAEQMLLKYLNLRQTFPHLMQNLDVMCPSVNELITTGYLYASPHRDSHGRRTIFYDAQKLDPYKYTSADTSKATFLAFEALLEDEETQVMGITHIADMAHVSASQITMWGPNELATVLKWGEQSIPLRHKKLHCLKMPSALTWISDFVVGRFSQKIKSRFMNHSSYEELPEVVDRHVLPKELGGTMPKSEMIELWKKELMVKRDRILALDEMVLLSNKNIIGRHTNKNNNNAHSTSQSGISSLPGSFRRLEVD